MRGRLRAAATALLLVLVVDLAATGCVSLPRSGAVRSTEVSEAVEGDTLIDYTPAGPRPGADPVPLVDAFLTSMTATPLTSHVARQFLTAASGRSWVPEKGTVVYRGLDLRSRPDGSVQVLLRGVVELDDRGTWLGDPTGGDGHDYRLRLARQDGQWRILDPPDRLLVPRSHFDTQYQQALIYFFDPTGRVLVPEPVYVPRGRQAPTMMVSALLKGPEPYLGGVERTFLPDGARLDGISVPVSGSGTAEVPLSAQLLEVGDRQLRLLSAQLAWTLGQVPSVERVRVTVAGTPVDLPGDGKDAAVDAWSRHDPAVAYASTELFGLRGGRLVTVDPSGRRQPVSGAFGALSLGLRSVAVDLLAQRTAGVT
ncbi:MAG: GerMN domain-containing protein, partial [Nocardioidaceae bacterium]